MRPHRARTRPDRLASENLQVRFASPEALRSEFEKNIANRGVFVASDQAHEVRTSVTVEVILDYVDPNHVALELDGEIVHCVPVELAGSGAVPGVAVQFEASAGDLCKRFEPLLGAEAATPVDTDSEGDQRRGSRRGAVRVPVRVMPAMLPPFEATSRDLSATGILLSVKDVALPVGELVRICLWHPSGNPSVEIDGEVVREVANKRGDVAAVAIAFDRDQIEEPRVRSVIDALREAGHRSRLGGISGAVSDLGLANMLQMFGSSAPQGTLVVEHEGEQGWIAFADEMLIGAELGAASGHDALVAMIGWGDGRFQFEASADPKLVESATRRPLNAAVLEAVCALDEAERDEDGDGDEDRDDETEEPGYEIDLEGGVQASIPIGEDTTFAVDEDQLELSRSALDKTDEAVLELASAGMAVARVRDVIPEPDDLIQASLEGLVELGVLVPR